MFYLEAVEIEYNKRVILEIEQLLLINQGHVMIFGEIGSGKSTLAKALIGFQQFSGRITYKNNQVKTGTLVPNITYVPQNLEYYFIMSRVIDEIKFVSGLTDEVIEALLKKYHLLGLKDHNPQTLSGGEKIRLVSLLCEVNESEVLIFDETVSMNDYQNLKIIINEIENYLQDNKLIIEITHDLERLESADQILFVNNHQIQEYDNVDDFKKDYLNKELG